MAVITERYPLIVEIDCLRLLTMNCEAADMSDKLQERATSPITSRRLSAGPLVEGVGFSTEVEPLDPASEVVEEVGRPAESEHMKTTEISRYFRNTVRPA